MRILFINNMKTLHGGAEIMADQLRRGLEGAGHEIILLAGDEAGSGRLIADRTFRSFADGSPARIMFLCNPFAVHALRQTLAAWRPDIVHLHNISKASPFILPLLSGYPTVMTLHDYLVFDPSRPGDIPSMAPWRRTVGDYFIDRPTPRYLLERLRFSLFRRWSRHIDAALACSRFFMRCALESGLWQDVRLVPNAIELPPLCPPTPGAHILFVGRLDPLKGAHILLEAAERARKEHPDLSVTLAGTGKERERLARLVERLGLSGSVRLPGYVQPERMRELYRDAALVAVPSLGPDNLPIVCIEAMATGRPVIGSRIGGIPDLIEHERTGLLVPPDDAAALAEGISKLLKDPARMKSMGLAGRRKAEREFSAEVYVERTLEVYEKVINDYTRR